MNTQNDSFLAETLRTTDLSDKDAREKAVQKAERIFQYIASQLAIKWRPQDFQNFIDILERLELEIDQPDNPGQNIAAISDKTSEVIQRVANLIKEIRLSSDIV